MQAACATDDLQFFGLYGVLGSYDFVSLVDAPDNEAAARFSLELGVRCGAHIETLPAVPIARFEARDRHAEASAEKRRTMDAPS